MSKIYRYIVAAAVTAIILFLVWYFSNIVVYILVAAVLAILGKPLTDFLSALHVGRARIRIPRWAAALLTLILIWLILVGLFWLFVPIVFQTIKQFSSLDITHVIQSFQEPLSVLERFIEKVFSLHDSDFSLMEAISRQITPLLDLNLINNLLSSIVSTVSGAVVAGVFHLVYYLFLLEGEQSVLQHGDHYVPQEV